MSSSHTVRSLWRLLWKLRVIELCSLVFTQVPPTHKAQLFSEYTWDLKIWRNKYIQKNSTISIYIIDPSFFSATSPNYPDCSSLQWLPPPLLCHLPPPLPQRPPVHVLLPPEGLGQHLPRDLRQPHPLPHQQRDPPEGLWPPAGRPLLKDGDSRRGGSLRHVHPVHHHLLGQRAALSNLEEAATGFRATCTNNPTAGGLGLINTG